MSGVRKYLWCLSCFWVLGGATSEAQSSLCIQWDETPPERLQLPQVDSLPLTDSVQVRAFLQNQIRQLHLAGYLAANIDGLSSMDSCWVAAMHLGPAYEWAEIDLEGVPLAWLRQAGVRLERLEGRIVDWAAWLKTQEQLLEYAENNGYPFARVSIGQLTGRGSKLAATIQLQTGPQIEFGGFEIVGDLRLSENYLENALGLRPGDLYSRADILRLRQRIEEIPFLTEGGSPKVRFAGDQAFLELELERKKASRGVFLIWVNTKKDEIVFKGKRD
ncbi:MAG: POTRA domain-containing protein [Bacteroidota bacterium]